MASEVQNHKDYSEERNHKEKEITFDEDYLKGLIENKYFYSDIMNVVSILIEELLEQIGTKQITH